MSLRTLAAALWLAAAPWACAAPPQGDTARGMAAMGLVDIADACPGVRVELMYARPDNFTGCLLYTDLSQAYLHPDAARALARAQRELQRLHPGYTLLVKDAARPMSAQKRMYQAVRGTSKARYVSNPARGGGLHNYGLAVDLTILDTATGQPLDMGTPVDHLGPEAGRDYEPRLTATARANRRLLRGVMEAGGFRPLRSEWWHFNLTTRARARAAYKLIP